MTTPTTPHAFPQIQSQTAGDLSVTEINDPGMTLRDYFAIRILYPDDLDGYDDSTVKSIVEHAYMVADMMLAAREVKP